MNNNSMKSVYLPVILLMVITLISAGCTDMPSSSDNTEPRMLTSATQNTSFSKAFKGNIPNGFIPNSQRYNDSSKPVATGKSGGVTLNARAMMNSQMVVDLEVISGELDSNADATGTIARLRVKALDSDNPDADNPVWEENYNNLSNGGSFAESYNNLLHGQQLDINANVLEMFKGNRNSARTGVVALLETVKYRPDLSVNDIDAPVSVFVLETVHIVAEIRENLGDLGATANCILRIDGEEIDRASGIWVDAGDAVNCAFQTQFETTGTKSGVVSVENVTPGDFYYGNNSNTFQIEVTELNKNDFYWQALAYIDLDDYKVNYDGNDGVTFESISGKRQYLELIGRSLNSVDFPMNIDVNVTSGGHTWIDESLTSINYATTWGSTKQSVTFLENNSVLYVNTDIGEYSIIKTQIYLQRYAQDVVYQGNSWNGSYYTKYDDTMLSYGDDITFNVTLDGLNGSAALMGELTLKEETYSYSYSNQWGTSSEYRRWLSSGYIFGSPN